MQAMIANAKPQELLERALYLTGTAMEYGAR
jgi:hypothetical protein